DSHAVADDRVALDLAVRADDSAALDFDIWADARVVADLAAVEVRERVDDDVIAELDIVDQAVRRVVDRTVSHARNAARRHRRRSRAALRLSPDRSAATGTRAR